MIVTSDVRERTLAVAAAVDAVLAGVTLAEPVDMADLEEVKRLIRERCPIPISIDIVLRGAEVHVQADRVERTIPVVPAAGVAP